MSIKIDIGNVSKVVNEYLETYSEAVQKEIKEQLPKVGKEAVKQLKTTSPVMTGQYAKGWTSKAESDRLSTKVIVYNKTDYQLTHLLEKGHALVGGGRTSAQPHIKPAQDKAEKKAIEVIKEAIQNA